MIKEVILRIAESGFFVFALPFILLFTILYAMLLKVRVFEGKKSINIIVAITISLLVVLLDFKTGKLGFIKFVSYIFPYTGLIIVGLFAWILVGGIFGVKIDWRILLAALIILELIIPESVLIIFFLQRTGQEIPSWLSFLQTPGFKTGLIMLAVFLGLVWFVTKEGKK